MAIEKTWGYLRRKGQVEALCAFLVIKIITKVMPFPEGMADINNSVKGLRDADIVIPNLCSRAQKDLKDEQ